MATYSYDAWGNGTASGPAAGIAQPFRFTGREWDADSGLYYYRARYYDPSIGRFISRDPLGSDGSANLYVYTENNPTNRVDPTGLQDAPAPKYPVTQFNEDRAQMKTAYDVGEKVLKATDAVLDKKGGSLCKKRH